VQEILICYFVQEWRWVFCCCGNKANYRSKTERKMHSSVANITPHFVFQQENYMNCII